jgi:hypothetical protein
MSKSDTGSQFIQEKDCLCVCVCVYVHMCFVLVYVLQLLLDEGMLLCVGLIPTCSKQNSQVFFLMSNGSSPHIKFVVFL